MAEPPLKIRPDLGILLEKPSGEEELVLEVEFGFFPPA